MAAQLLIINPEKSIGGKKVAKKRKGKKPGPKKGSRKKTRRTYRYRNPSKTSIEREMKEAVPIVLAGAAGFGGSRVLINMLIPQQGAYVRAVAQAGLGILAYFVLGKFTSRPSLLYSFMIGAGMSGVLAAVDTATGGKYNLADEEIIYIPENIDPYLVSGIGGTGDYVSTPPGLASYVPYSEGSPYPGSRPFNYGDSDIYDLSQIPA